MESQDLILIRINRLNENRQENFNGYAYSQVQKCKPSTFSTNCISFFFGFPKPLISKYMKIEWKHYKSIEITSNKRLGEIIFYCCC